MNRDSRMRQYLAVMSLCGTVTAALAQASDASRTGLADSPSPYYVGVNQAFTHDSNVTRVPFGSSDNYSSSSLLGGFDQGFSRQRVYGTAAVSLNRYQDQTQLNNTSYSLAAGLDWATVEKLSGDVAATLNRNLSAPLVINGSNAATRNTSTNRGVSGSARWGGDGPISAFGRLGYSKQDNSGGQFLSTSNNEFASIGSYYRPGTSLQVGLAARIDRTRAPYALQLADGTFQGNELKGRNLDLLLNYNNGNTLNAAARVSLTRQTNTSIGTANFSGLTGSLNAGYRATGKLSFSVAASRDAGYNATSGIYAPQVVSVTPAPPTTAPINTTATLYENNQVTNSLSAGASYAATAKIGLTANLRYAKAKLVALPTQVAGIVADEVTDTSSIASLGANYAFSRALSFACNVSRERRRVTGQISYAYTDSLAACSGQFLWR